MFLQIICLLRPVRCTEDGLQKVMRESGLQLNHFELVEDRHKTSRPWQRFLWNLVKLVVSLGLLAWLALHIDWADFLDVLRMIPGPILISGFLLFFLAQVLAARRLQILLSTQKVQIRYLVCLRLVFVGLFANNFLPSTVGGDTVKIVALVQAGYGRSVAILSVITDRLINLLVLVLLLPTIFSLSEIVDLEIVRVCIWFVGGFVLGGIMLISGGYLLVRHRSSNVSEGNSGLVNRIARLELSIHTVISEWMAQPLIILCALGISVMVVFSGFVAIAIQMAPMGLRFGFIEVTAVFVFVYFVTLVPVSLNGIGVQEVSLVYLLTQLGATSGQATALALLVRMFNIAVSLPGAVFLVTRPGLQPGCLKEH